jgi:RimJ/RimL family protein N-acetyltransferase
MIQGTLVDLVPFEDDFATRLPAWMNEEAWFRAHPYRRREPQSEHDAKRWIEHMEKNERGKLIGVRAKNGDPVGGVTLDRLESRVRKAEANFFAGDARYEGADERLDGLLLLLRYGFETRNIGRLEAAALAFDSGRIDLLRRAGFVHEGTLRRHLRWNGAYVDLEFFGALQREWPGYAAQVAALALRPATVEPLPRVDQVGQV